MNNKIQSFWFGKPLSTMERLCINSFLKNGHIVDIYSYDEIPNLPLGTNILDANTIIDRKFIFFDSAGGIASFSDWFRYKLLYDKGGWWVDLDVICLKPFDIADDFCFATEKFSHDYKTGITNCVIKSQSKAEFLKMILEHIDSFENYKNINWGQFGPALIQSILSQFDSEKFMQPTSTFCPIDWTEMMSIINCENELPSDSLAIHLWNNLWRLNNIEKDHSYRTNCIYERLKAKYL